MAPLKDRAATQNELTAAAIEHVMEALRTLRFGTIQMTIHEGRLVQVDVTERNRFTA